MLLVLTDEEVEFYRRAGRIAAQVRSEVIGMVKPGVKIIDICEFVERRIVELGGKPAFPCNVSVNEIAAHYTSYPEDPSTVPDDGIVKVDIGVHINGYIADTAVSIPLSPKYEDLVHAAEEALERAIEIVRPGVRALEIGAVIESTAKKYGLKPIKNLGGHSLAPYTIHAGESIPNHKDPLSIWRLRDGAAYAIEPFITSGAGLVEEVDLVTIYALRKISKVKGLTQSEQRVFRYVASEFRTLPFCLRWLNNLGMSREELENSVRRLVGRGLLRRYPVLVEVRRGIVAQAEDTILINRGEVLVITRA